jgi:hypothetical protein
VFKNKGMMMVGHHIANVNVVSSNLITRFRQTNTRCRKVPGVVVGGSVVEFDCGSR